MIQPFQNFAKYLEKPEDINGWGIFDWWNLPHRFRKEYLQNLGAMQALIDYILSKASVGRSRFSGRVVLAGGSAGRHLNSLHELTPRFGKRLHEFQTQSDNDTCDGMHIQMADAPH